jgi:cytochrome d ubiquinol oxidase subunit II
LFGVAFGNLFLGLPFAFDDDLRAHPAISLFGLLSPFALLVGLVSVATMALHGATWLRMKAAGAVGVRAGRVVPFAALAFAVFFAVCGLWLIGIDGYRITSTIASNTPSNPLLKTVAQVRGAWFDNFDAHRFYWLLPLLAYAGAALAGLARRPAVAFVGSSAVCIFTVATAGVALFPFLLPSSTAPDSSLTVWDASSTAMTLGTMLVAAAIFLPFIAFYTIWIHRVLRGALTPEQIDEHGSY